MKRGKKILAFLLIITMLLPFVMNIPAEAAEKSKQLDVLFTHDTHSHLNSFSTIVDGEQKEVGGFAKLKTLIDEKKKENPDTLILDGGDFSMFFAAISTFLSFCDAQKSSVPGATLQVDIIRFT